MSRPYSVCRRFNVPAGEGGRMARPLRRMKTKERQVMNRLMVNALQVGIAAALAMGISACNRDASADAGLANGSSSAEAGNADAGAKYARVVSVDQIGRASCRERVESAVGG